MELPRIARKTIEVDVAATLPSGAPAEPSGVSFALCDHGGPTGATVWVQAAAWDSTAKVAQVVLCGREATDTSGAGVLVAVAGQPRAELWAKPTNGSIVDAGFIDTIECL